MSLEGWSDEAVILKRVTKPTVGSWEGWNGAGVILERVSLLVQEVRAQHLKPTNPELAERVVDAVMKCFTDAAVDAACESVITLCSLDSDVFQSYFARKCGVEEVIGFLTFKSARLSVDTRTRALHALGALCKNNMYNADTVMATGCLDTLAGALMLQKKHAPFVVACLKLLSVLLFSVSAHTKLQVAGVIDVAVLLIKSSLADSAIVHSGLEVLQGFVV